MHLRMTGSPLIPMHTTAASQVFLDPPGSSCGSPMQDAPEPLTPAVAHRETVMFELSDDRAGGDHMAAPPVALSPDVGA